MEKVEGGQTLEDALTVSRLLAEEGVDALDVSLICYGSWREVDGRQLLVASSALPKTEQAGANVALAAAVKEATGLPVIAVGKLGEESIAEETVRKTPVDVIAIGHQMIVDPGTAGKIISGDELQTALNEIKTLKGFIPICSSCKKIRTDSGYWEQIEQYIREHSEAEFTHGICPDCMKKLYPEFVEEKD